MLVTLRRFVFLFRDRFVAIEPLDRGFALGSRLFVAVLPLSLVAQRVTDQDTSMGSLLTSAFRLQDSGRDAAETLFAPPVDVGAGLGLFAIVVLFYSLRGFARGMQRLYLDLWRVRLSGPTAIVYQVFWAAWLAAYLLFDIVLAGLRLEPGASEWLGLLGGLALYAGMWALTLWLLLGRRVSLRRLAPSIAMTALAVAAFEAVSRLYFPELASTNAERYGLIGFAFSLFSWFFVHQVVVVLAGLLGAVVDEVLGVPAAEPGLQV